MAAAFYHLGHLNSMISLFFCSSTFLVYPREMLSTPGLSLTMPDSEGSIEELAGWVALVILLLLQKTAFSLVKACTWITWLFVWSLVWLVVTIPKMA